MEASMTERTHLGATEYDPEGQARRVHAVAAYADEIWINTVCGLAVQAYPLTGAAWGDVPPGERCDRCISALDE